MSTGFDIYFMKIHCIKEESKANQQPRMKPFMGYLGHLIPDSHGLNKPQYNSTCSQNDKQSNG